MRYREVKQLASGHTAELEYETQGPNTKTFTAVLCCLPRGLMTNDQFLASWGCRGWDEEDRKRKPIKVVGKVLRVWYLQNKTVGILFIVIFSFIITFQEAWDRMGTGLGQMEVGEGRAC